MLRRRFVAHTPQNTPTAPHTPDHYTGSIALLSVGTAVGHDVLQPVLKSSLAAVATILTVAISLVLQHAKN